MTTAVGPVLEAGALAAAVIAAIRAAHPDAEVLDRGAYLRVSVPARCRIARVEIERRLGAPFRLPADLERIMPSFAGRLTITDDDVRWEATRP